MIRENYERFLAFWERRQLNRFRKELRYQLEREIFFYLKDLRDNGMAEFDVMKIGEAHKEMVNLVCSGRAPLLAAMARSVHKEKDSKDVVNSLVRERWVN